MCQTRRNRESIHCTPLLSIDHDTHYGKLALLPRSHLAMTLKREDLPTLGSPTIPIFKLLEGLPSLGFSTTCCFFGGILFLTWYVSEVEKGRMWCRAVSDAWTAAVCGVVVPSAELVLAVLAVLVLVLVLLATLKAVRNLV